MFRSVRWRLLFNSLAVSLAAIMAVGVVTLLLVDAHFTRQEEAYLSARANEIIQPLELVIGWGGRPVELQQVARIGALAAQLRVKVFDAEGRLLADSGPAGKLPPALPESQPQLSRLESAALRFFIDDSGQVHALIPSPPGGWSPIDSQGPVPQALDAPRALPPLARESQAPVSAGSDTHVRLPLVLNSVTVGFVELSEGPALGQVVRQGVQGSLLAGSIAAVVIAVAVGLFSARQVIRPLRSLGRAADEMAAGDLTARAPTSNLGEFDNLAAQFNSMADQLSATIASLEADRATLRRFIADASHELRTPITALTTFNELLAQEEVMAGEPAATFIDQSSRQLSHLDRLTAGLLDISRLETRLSGTNFAHTDLRPVLSRAVNDRLPFSQAKGQTLRLDLPAEPVSLPHDAAALEQAVGDLIINAIKYTPDGGRIQVRLEEAGQQASITVEDDGIGIPDSEQPFIFDRFYRGQNSQEPGSGLGLAICQEIVFIHGGAVECTSREGEGTTFTIRLPLPDYQS